MLRALQSQQALLFFQHILLLLPHCAPRKRGFASGGICCACDECVLCPQLQSLQSELQFKDAEMNELRTKLQCSERAHKPAVPSTSHGRSGQCWRGNQCPCLVGSEDSVRLVPSGGSLDSARGSGPPGWRLPRWLDEAGVVGASQHETPHCSRASSLWGA